MSGLTQGAIQALCSLTQNMKPTLQVISIKESKDKLLVHISDGEQHIPVYLASQTIKKVKDEGKEITVNCIIQVEKYSAIPHTKNSKPWPVVMVTTLTLISQDSPQIGNPKQPVGAEGSPQAVKQEVSSPNAKKSTSAISPAPAGPTMATTPPKAAAGPPKSSSASPLAMSQGTDRVVLIGDLNPYMQRWTIKGRVVAKRDVRSFKGKNSSEKRVFEVTVMDESCDIKIIFWDELCDKFFDSLEMGKCFTFSQGTLKMANKKFNDTKSDYEMSAKSDIKIELCQDSEAPAVRYHFTSIDKLEDHIGKAVDVMGIVQDVQPLGEITIKKGPDAGKQKNKRNVSLADKSGRLVVLTLWDDHAMTVTEEHQSSNSVVCVRAVKVGDYNGCSINTTRGSLVQVDPDIPEAKDLSEWFTGRADAVPFQAVGGGGGGKGEKGPAPRRLIADINEKGLGLGDKPDYFTIRAMITYFRNKDNEGNTHTWQYPSNPENKKKVIQVGNEWQDESLGKVIKECQRRYILSLSCCDISGSNFFMAFDDQAKQILGTSADELYQASETDPKAAEAIWAKGLFQTMILKVRAKNERYNDQDRVKCSIVECSPVNYKEEAKQLNALIQKYGV